MPVLVAVAGLAGAVGSTLSAGLLQPPGEAQQIGLATESPRVRELACSLLPLDQIRIDGWDLDLRDLSTVCFRHRICPNAILEAAASRLATIIPRLGIVPQAEHVGDWIQREASYLRASAQARGADSIVVVNLCPTEAGSAHRALRRFDWQDLSNLGQSADCSPSAIYFRLAIEAKAHFINFTPNPVEIPVMRRAAKKSGIVYAGRDGKTGQTFIKTTLAPAFRDRNLRIDGWFSLNLLGNADGRTLAKKSAGRTKISSKRKSLQAIVGYEPASHQIHIHFYPPRGDAKEAWDAIDFSGFMGIPMQMKIDWLGVDSILAAPVVIDLVRLVVLASERGFSGPLEEAAYFFKDPIATHAQDPIQHSVPEQFELLLRFLGNGATRDARR